MQLSQITAGILTVFTLSATLPAHAQVKKVRLGEVPPHLAIVSIKLIAPASNATRGIVLCDTTGACRSAPLPRKAGKVTRITRAEFVDKAKTAASFLTYSDTSVSMCYASASSMAATCAPVVSSKTLGAVSVRVMRSKGSGQPLLVFTQWPNTAPSAPR